MTLRVRIGIPATAHHPVTARVFRTDETGSHVDETFMAPGDERSFAIPGDGNLILEKAEWPKVQVTVEGGEEALEGTPATDDSQAEIDEAIAAAIQEGMADGPAPGSVVRVASPPNVFDRLLGRK